MSTEPKEREDAGSPGALTSPYEIHLHPLSEDADELQELVMTGVGVVIMLLGVVLAVAGNICVGLALLVPGLVVGGIGYRALKNREVLGEVDSSLENPPSGPELHLSFVPRKDVQVQRVAITLECRRHAYKIDHFRTKHAPRTTADTELIESIGEDLAGKSSVSAGTRFELTEPLPIPDHAMTSTPGIVKAPGAVAFTWTLSVWIELADEPDWTRDWDVDILERTHATSRARR